jgi:hypothetical protein
VFPLPEPEPLCGLGILATFYPVVRCGGWTGLQRRRAEVGVTAKNPLPRTVRAPAYSGRYRPPNGRRAGAELSLEELASARKAVAEVILRRIRCGEPVSDFPELLARLDDLLIIGSGHGTGTSTDGGELSAELIDTVETATLLECSPEWVRKIAPGLGGQLIGGKWFIPRRNVLEHLSGKGIGGDCN